MRRWGRIALVACFAACTGTRTGNPVMGSEGTGSGQLTGANGNCDSTEKPLSSLDQKTELGISANDVLAFTAGTHESSIRWQMSEIAQFTPESGEHGLSVTLTATAPAVLVKYKEKPPSANGSGGLLGIGEATGSCADLDAIEIPVVAEIKSDGGALNEKIKGRLRARNALWATLHLDLKADKLGGELALVSTKPAGFTLVQLAIDLGLSPLGMRGTLSGVLEMRSADSVTNAGGASTGSAAANPGALAVIGSNASCDDGGLPIALDHALQGFSMQNALDLLASANMLDGVWQDGHSGSFEMSVELGSDAVACALLDPGPVWEMTTVGTLRLHARLHLTSDDGKLDSHWPIVLDATPAEDGSLKDVSIALDTAQLGQPSAAMLDSVYGVHGVDASGYDSVQVMLQMQVEPGDQVPSVSGMFKLMGIKLAECAKQPPPPPEPTPDGSQGTGSSPGCAGADLTDLVSVTW